MKNNIRRMFAVALGVILTVSAFASPANIDQPFMEKARNNLQDARGYLNRATADKGGYRNNALNKVNQAINSVNNGISYDRTHRNSTDENMNFDPVARGDQPNMVRAREELQKAIDNLEKANADKGGWRNKAMVQAREAINQVNAGIEYDRRH